MPRDDLEESFPGLRTAEYRITSPPDANYNCVAWAAGDSQRWWDPALEPGYFWPPHIARTLSLANLVAALATLGFEPGADDSLEPEFEKLVIYSDDHGWPTHVARQLPSESWTSKLGLTEDIEHSTVQALEGAILVALGLESCATRGAAKTEIRITNTSKIKNTLRFTLQHAVEEE